MADNTAIEWTDATWNPITGCSVISPGCTNCYAMRLAGTRLRRHPTRAGLTREVNGNHVWTGETRLNEAALLQPLRWKTPRRIFVCAHGDLFHESVPDEWIARVFAVMAQAPQHTFQVLTKRSNRMRQLMNGPKSHDLWHPRLWHRSTLPNVWLGVSVEDQARADERIPALLATPAAVRFLSMEPLLGPVDLTLLHHDGVTNINSLRGKHGVGPGFDHDCAKIDWVIVGGESGSGARPMHPDWARSLRDQCQTEGVPFFYKQWGEYLPANSEDDGERLTMWPDDGRDLEADFSDWGVHPIKYLPGQEMWRVGKKRAGRLLDGREWSEFPA